MPRRAKTLGRRRVNRKKTACRRGYDRQWRNLRAWFLKTTPYCQDCDDRDIATLATEVHHKVKIADRPDLRLDPRNLRSLCKTCHSRRTARGE